MFSKAVRSLRHIGSLFCFLSTMTVVGTLSAQTPALAAGVRTTPDRLLRPIDEGARVKLTGTLHPLATKASDRGPVSDGLKLDRMQIMLKRSDAQETELKQLIGDMHTPNSANFHKWLTPDDFGKRFGPSDADVAKLEGWLSSHGFSITKLNPGRQTLEIAGTAGQFRDTFHSTIHSYQVKGQTQFANSVEPEIPAALAPVFGGFASLNNFPARAYSQNLGKASYNPVTHESKPEWTRGNSAPYSYVIAPADFAVQYDLNPLYTAGTDGTGQSIAIINEANINVAQVNKFRTLFGLPPNPPQVIIDGNDPGIDGINSPYGPNGATFEAYLDVEWAGAVAPKATINLVIAASTAVEDGLALAAERAVYSNISPVISISFGNCEAQLQSGNAFYSNLWEQAAAQGITVMVSSGDSGSAGCDNDNTQSFAYRGQAVNGFASTPYNVAVGGTDFFYNSYAGTTSAQNAELATYWSQTPSNGAAATESLLQHIPEQPWNGSQFGLNARGYEQTIAGGGGGASTAGLGTTVGGTTTYGPYPKPSWQTGTGVPADGVRDIPDVSLFASLNSNYSYFPLCANDGDCQPGTSTVQISGVGGTSESAPSFAGIMALVNQKYGRQGQANYVLYPLAAQHPEAFYDVTNGSISVPCNLQTVSSSNTGAVAPTDCIAGSPAVTIDDADFGTVVEGQIGLANTPAYNAGTGYDLASGLGTVNANALVSNWNSVVFAESATTLTPSSTSFTHGSAVTLTGGVAPTASGGATPTGTVSLITDSTEPSQQGQTRFTLANGTFNDSINFLPGGTYNIWGYYSGDGVNAASTSAKTQITVAPENSTTALTIYSSLTTNTGNPLPASGGSVQYGQPMVLRAGPAGATSAGQSTPPTGTVAFTDGSTVVNTAVLNAEGDAEYSHAFPVGSHSITAAYSGDASYNASTSSAISFTVTKLQPRLQLVITNQDSNGIVGSQATTVSIFVENLSTIAGGAAAPSGTVTLAGAPSGSTTTATLNPAVDPNSGDVEGIGTFTIPAGANGTYNLNFTYNGDSNYATVSGTSQATFSLSSGRASTTTATATAMQTSPAARVLLTATIAGPAGSAAPTGTVDVVANGYLLTEFTLAQSSTNSVVATLALNSQNLLQGTNQLTIQYYGDNTYLPSSTTINIANPLNDFQMVPLTTIVNAPSATPATDTINLISTNSFAGAVNLTCAGAAGITCSLSPASATLSAGGSASTVLTVNTSGVTVAGTYNVVVTGTDSTGNFIHTVGLQVVVPVAAAPVPGFTLTNSAAIAIPAPGQPGTSIVSVTPTNGFIGDVALTCAITSSPSGATGTPTCSPSPATASITGAAAVMSTLTVNTDASTTPGSYTATITGVSGGITQTTTAAVTVTGPSFSLAGTAVSAITRGSSGTSTITMTPETGFAGTVSLSCAVSGAAGATLPGCSLSPTTVTAAAATSTLTITTTAPTTASLSLPLKSIFAAGGGVAMAALLFFGFPVRRKSGKLKLIRLLSLAVFFALLAGVGIGCGGGKSTPPPPTQTGGTTVGSYTVTVTGTSNGVTKTTTVAVTVN